MMDEVIRTRIAKLLTEFIGTFFLCLTVALTAKTSAIAAIAIGFVLMVCVFAGGHCSGAHYNPAVTLAILLRGAISPLEALMYVPCQICGAVAATLFSWVLIGKDQSGYPALGSNVGVGAAFLAELMITFALCSVVLHTATSKAQANNSYYGLAIGSTVLSGAISVGPFSGGAFNPAVGFMCVLYGGDDSKDIWIYLLAPLLAGALAAGAFRLVAPDEFTETPNPLQNELAPLIVEATGTALLCFTVATAGGGTSFLAPLSIGCMLMVMVYMGGSISGAHYNPAVTLGVLLRTYWGKTQDDFTAVNAGQYVLSQIVGAFIGAVCGWGVWETNTLVGYPAPYSDLEKWGAKCVLGEILGTFLLVYVVLNVATLKQLAGNSFFGLAIGQVVTAMVCAIGPVSGGAFNPAVGLVGPFTGGQNIMKIRWVWIYWIACPIGAVFAAAFFRIQNYEEFKANLGEKRKFMAHVHEDAHGSRFHAHAQSGKVGKVVPEINGVHHSV